MRRFRDEAVILASLLGSDKTEKLRTRLPLASALARVVASIHMDT